MKCAYICKASSTLKWWLQLVFYDYYFDFTTPPLLPLWVSTRPSPSPPTPHKALFFTDLQESTSVSLPLLAQPQTAAMSLFFKVTLKIGNVEKISHMGENPGCFLEMEGSTGQKHREHWTQCVLYGKRRNCKEVHACRSVKTIKGVESWGLTRS